MEDQKAVGIKGITDGEFRRGFGILIFRRTKMVSKAMFQKLDIIKHSTEKQLQLIISGVVDKLSFNPKFILKDFAFSERSSVKQMILLLQKQRSLSPTMILRQEILSNDGFFKNQGDLSLI